MGTKQHCWLLETEILQTEYLVWTNTQSCIGPKFERSGTDNKENKSLGGKIKNLPSMLYYGNTRLSTC